MVFGSESFLLLRMRERRFRGRVFGQHLWYSVLSSLPGVPRSQPVFAVVTVLLKALLSGTRGLWGIHPPQSLSPPLSGAQLTSPPGMTLLGRGPALRVDSLAVTSGSLDERLWDPQAK